MRAVFLDDYEPVQNIHVLLYLDCTFGFIFLSPSRLSVEVKHLFYCLSFIVGPYDGVVLNQGIMYASASASICLLYTSLSSARYLREEAEDQTGRLLEVINMSDGCLDNDQ